MHAGAGARRTMPPMAHSFDYSASAGTTRVRRLALEAHWLPARPAQALLCFEEAAGGAFTVCAAEPRSEALARSVERGHGLPLHETARRLGTPLFDAAAPVPLQPVRVEKAWGEELWFTGIEARGVVRAGTEENAVPLPWLLAARPDAFGGVAAPILVKVLAASADADAGDLYFEVHREKEEVYVVASVDPDAWPDGRGRVRYGFDPEALATLGEDGFRAAFEAAAQENARAVQALDARCDPAPGQERLANVRLTRGHLQHYTNVRSLAPGDVVRVPAGLPHGLMHGVRVIEFQTPRYERRVLYANQPLAAGDRLPLADAPPALRMDVPDDPSPVDVEAAPGVRTSRIARMRDFEVRRYLLDAGASTPLPPAPYGVLVGLAGSLACGAMALAPEQAALLSREALQQPLAAGEAGATALLATPAQAT